jgi:AcrR family transcriptional regulator
MEDLAKSLGISKKTIYKHFKNKEEIIENFIVQAHHDIKEKQRLIYDKPISLLEKIKELLQVIPVNSELFTDENLKNLNIYFPKLYRKVENFFESDWERTYSLLDEAKEKSLIKNIDNGLFKQLYLCGCLYDNFNNKKAYRERLIDLTDYLFEGIKN